MAGGISLDRTMTTQEARDLLEIVRDETPYKGALEVLQTRVDYPLCNEFFREDRVTVTGPNIEQKVMIDLSGNASFVKPYSTTAPAVSDVMATFRLPWRIAHAHWSIDRSEVLRSRNKTNVLVDLVQVRRTDASMSHANLIEPRLWQTPPSSSDEEYPHGLPYHLVPITSAQVSAATSGHQGANAVGFNDCMGIDASAAQYDKWQSYTEVWDNNTPTITEDDVEKVVEMRMRLKFAVPMNVKDLESGRFDNFRAYCGMNRMKALDKKARENNDSLGADLGKFAGAVRINGTPIRWVEDLDDVSTQPMYFINHDYFGAFVLEGDFFSEDEPVIPSNQPRVMTTHCWLTYNTGIIKNRRKAGGRIDYVT